MGREKNLLDGEGGGVELTVVVELFGDRTAEEGGGQTAPEGQRQGKRGAHDDGRTE